ncbi:MAG TPA: hypothetical protein VIL46_12470, partial [Gemmataceae bacterium]
AAPLRMLMRLGDGEPRFEVKNGDELLLKVYGDRMEMPPGGPTPRQGLPCVSAVGKVRFWGPGVSGTCEQLTVMSPSGEILLKGAVQMECKKGDVHHRLAAEEVMFQLGGTRFQASGTSEIMPASYRNK